MVKYKKIISSVVIVAILGWKICHSTEIIDTYDVEKGLGESFQISNLDKSQQEQINEQSGAVCTADLTEKLEAGNGLGIANDGQEICAKFFHPDLFYKSIYSSIDQIIHHYGSSPIVQQYLCDVASSVTSGLILYLMYQWL